MDISIKELQAGEVEMTVCIPSATVSEEIERKYRDVQKKVAMKGFRRGKVPMAMLRKTMEGQVLNDVVNELIQETYPKAVAEKELAPIQQGVIEKVDHTPGGDLSFTARIEVEPDVPLTQVTGLTVERLKRDVNDADIDRSMEELRTRYASWVPCEDGAADGDQLSCDIQENDSMGLPIDKRLYKNIQVELGKGQYGPDFDQKMTGVKPGEARDISITNPEDDPDPETAGKTEYYTVTVHEVKRAEKAELNDDFAQEIPPGFDTLDALKAHARVELGKSLERSIEQTVNNKLVELLIDANPFEVPRKMIDIQLDDLLERAKKGTTNPIDDDIVRATYEPQIERQIRWNLIAKAILKQQNIRIGDAEMDAEIQRIATEQGQTVETVRLQLKRGDSFRRVAESLVERSLFDYLRSNSTIVDKDAEPETV